MHYIVEEKPPIFYPIEFEYKQHIFEAQIGLLDNNKMMISFAVTHSVEEQNFCKKLQKSRGTILTFKINHIPLQAKVDTSSFTMNQEQTRFRDCNIIFENSLMLCKE